MIRYLNKAINKIISNEVALNTAWQLFERFFGLGGSFISSIFVIRYLAPEEYGIFAYASSYVTLFSALTTMGLQSIVVREMVKKNISSEELMGSAFFIMISGAIAAATLAVSGALYFHGKSITNWVILILCLVNIVNSFAVINYYLQAEIKSRYIAYVMLIQDVADICIKITLVYLKAHLISFALIGLIESIFTNILIFIVFRNYSTLSRWIFSKKTVKYLLWQSLPLAVSGIMINLYMRLDQVMIEYYCGMQAVAEYSIGVKLIELLYIIPAIIMPNLYPVAIKLFQRSEMEFEILIKKIYKWAIRGSIIISGLITVLGSKIIQLLYGSAYSESGLIFEIGVWCIVPVYLGVFSNLWSQPKNLQKYYIHMTIIGVVSCCFFNFLLIPRFKIVGAIIATVITQCLSSVLVMLVLPKMRKNILLIVQSCFPQKV